MHSACTHASHAALARKREYKMKRYARNTNNANTNTQSVNATANTNTNATEMKLSKVEQAFVSAVNAASNDEEQFNIAVAIFEQCKLSNERVQAIASQNVNVASFLKTIATERAEQKAKSAQKLFKTAKNEFSHRVNSQAARIDQMLISALYTVADIASNLDTTESRVRSHIAHLRSKSYIVIKLHNDCYKLVA